MFDWKTPEDFPGVCFRCFLRHAWCLCHRIPTIKTQVEYVIVRHFKEMYKTTNSARLAHMALANSTMVEFGIWGYDFDHSVLAGDHVYLLFPSVDGSSGLYLPEEDKVLQEYPRPDKLVILDGSWRQARRMTRRIKELRSLPHLTLSPAPEDTKRIRKPPHVWKMATIEAIARAVEEFEGPQQADLLDQLFLDLFYHYHAMRRGLPVERYLQFLAEG